MRRSLSARLAYSFMAVIVCVIVAASVGVSYLVGNYFFSLRERELGLQGDEMAGNISYFISIKDKDTLQRYINAVDQLIGARIWLFDDSFHLLAASYIEGPKSRQPGYNIGIWDAFFDKDRGNNELQSQEGIVALDKAIKEGDLSQRVRIILKDIYGGKSLRSQVFHPYYKEQVLMVGLPYHNTIDGTTGAILITTPLGDFDNFLRNIYIYVALVGLCALGFSLFLVNRLARRFIKPLVDMKGIATAIAGGDYSRRVTIKGDDEVADLGRALNSLGADLGDYVDKMQRTEKIRRDFVANVSHELRTPITIIRGYNEAISDGIITDQAVLQRYRGLINEETVRLERMVRELLDISRLQAEDPLAPESLEALPLATIIRTVAEKLLVSSARRHIKFNIQADDGIKILGNGDQLVQLVLILCDNASKYSPEDGTITLSLRRQEDGSVLLKVHDDGPGIPEEDLPFIWERFYKVDKSHSRNRPGSGLGLAIAKEIVRVHGASAKVTSKRGEGTTFEINFPKVKVV